jgi:hypothetical protein
MSSFKGKGAARSPETTPKKELVLPSSYPATWVLVVRAPHDSPAVKWQDWKSFQQDIRQHIKYQPGETHVIVLPELETKIALCELEKKEEADRAFGKHALLDTAPVLRLTRTLQHTTPPKNLTH